MSDASVRARRATAASHMTSKVPTVAETVTVSQALETVLGGEWDSAQEVWVLDSASSLVGVALLEDLLRADPGHSISDVCEPAPPSVSADLDQESVALHAIRHRQHAVPVTAQGGAWLGVVPAAALLRILRTEHVEDLHRLVGIKPEPSGHHVSFDEPPARSAWHRLPWLFVGLAGSVVATWTMSSFEDQLQQRVALGFFVPGIVYLADAVGTQSETLAVRRLSRRRAVLGRLVARELGTGTLVGAVLALATFAVVWAGFSELRLAAAVALSVLFSGALATTIGVALPWMLARLGKDPAFGSGPLATIVQDCLSILVYFAIATRLFP